MRMETVSESGMLSSLWMMLFMAGLGWAESWSEVDVGGGGLEPNHAHLSSYSHSHHSTLLLTTLTWANNFVAKTFQIWILMIVVWCDCEVVKSIWKKMIEVNMKGGDGDERLSIWCFLFCFLPRPYFLSEDYIYRSNTHSASQESFTFSLWLLSLVRFHGFTILNIKYILVKIQNKMFLFSILTTKL